jgi:hypothetical protein
MHYTEYVPDQWVMVKVTKDLYKIFGSWRGGYTIGDSWRINSGIERTEDKGDHYLFYGYSGSVYKCYKDQEGAEFMGPYNQSILSPLADKIVKAKYAGK